MKYPLQPTLSFFYACLFVILLLLGLSGRLVAQMRITDMPQSTTINENAVLELASNSKALLLPRLNNTQIQAMQNVPAGMLVYSSTDNVLYIRTNSDWVTLAQAANAASVTNPFSTTNGTTIYTSASKVGIGTSNPSSQLANNTGNTAGSDGQGGNAGSLSWAASQPGYVGQIYNDGTGVANNGLVVKVNSTTATAFDVLQGTQNNGGGASLLTVKSDKKVGIGTANPSEALDVSGNIKYSGNLQMGLQYVFKDADVPGSSYGAINISCPVGTKLIGGGGGQRDSNGLYEFTIAYSGPNKNDTNNWVVSIKNSNNSTVAMRIYAICAKVQ